QYVKRIAWWDQERAAWASQWNPPAPGATWTVSLTGRVTDASGHPVPDAEVMVTHWQGHVVRAGQSHKTKTGPDGRCTITLKCEKNYRLKVTGMRAEKRGLVAAVDGEDHKLLPGQSAKVDFVLKPGEAFGGTLNIRSGPSPREMPQWLIVIGPGVR